jgi:transposase
MSLHSQGRRERLLRVGEPKTSLIQVVRADMAKNPATEVQGFAGIDVSARELSVAVRSGTVDREEVHSFSNNAAGHHALLSHLLCGKRRVRVCLEASGNYSLDLALTLHAHRRMEVSVVNPRRARRFAESLGERSKTDPVDAHVLCQYAVRMPWVPWVPPSGLALRLRGLTRAIEALGVTQTREKNRQHSLRASRALPTFVIRELQRHLEYLQLRITRLRREALRLIARAPELDRRFRLMLTTPGIGETNALQILGELAVLPATLDARQWVAFAGLDPVRFTSGTTVDKKPRISRGGSRHLRRALYMPALVAIRHEPHLRAFFQRLVTHGKAPLQAVVAVMRKLLHAFFAMFRSDHSYDGSKLCLVELPSDSLARCAA